ncbi:hypothetical protein [Trichormus azollae]|uniref:hypothetical protein n=1 Tax=Trichormus azollae TaxID=1164 RepID=UPI00325EFA6E
MSVVSGQWSVAKGRNEKGVGARVSAVGGFPTCRRGLRGFRQDGDQGSRKTDN